MGVQKNFGGRGESTKDDAMLTQPSTITWESNWLSNIWRTLFILSISIKISISFLTHIRPVLAESRIWICKLIEWFQYLCNISLVWVESY